MRRPLRDRGDGEPTPAPPRETAPEFTLHVPPSQLPARVTDEGSSIAQASSQAPAASAPADSGEAPPRKVSVGPEDVFQAGQILRGRWREHSFFAPILLVVLISAALVYGGVAVVGIILRLLR